MRKMSTGMRIWIGIGNHPTLITCFISYKNWAQSESFHSRHAYVNLEIVDTSITRATSHTTHKVHDHCVLRSFIGWKDRDHSSSLHTSRWRPEDPKKSLWMKSLQGFLHGKLWITFHGLLEFASGISKSHETLSIVCHVGPHHVSGTMFPANHVRVKTPHNYMVTALGSCVKWP